MEMQLAESHPPSFDPSNLRLHFLLCLRLRYLYLLSASPPTFYQCRNHSVITDLLLLCFQLIYGNHAGPSLKDRNLARRQH